MTPLQRIDEMLAHMEALRRDIPTPLQDNAAAVQDLIYDLRLELEGEE